MEYGQISGVTKPVSRLVQGTAGISSAHLDETFALLDAVYAEGCNTFDTAHVYGRGDVERTFGRWVRERAIRDQVVIIGKGAHLSEDRSRVTPFDIEADLHDSFARFGFDFIDIYFLHRDDPNAPVGPLMEVLNKYHAAGKIGIFGGSNWSVERLEEANEYADKHNLIPFTASSPNFSLAAQHEAPWPGCVSITDNRAARDWYAAQGMAVFAWSSLAGGFFSGRFHRNNLDSFSEPIDKLCVTTYCYDDNFQRLERAEQLAQQYGMTLPQIAMAYVTNQPLNIYALVGCRTVDEFRANAAALALKLTPEQLAWLEMGTPVPGTPEPA